MRLAVKGMVRVEYHRRPFDSFCARSVDDVSRVSSLSYYLTIALRLCKVDYSTVPDGEGQIV